MPIANYHVERTLRWIRKKHYSRLTLEDWSLLNKYGIINGCGGKWCAIRPPCAIMFHASCDIHDFTYWQGLSEWARLKDDWWFLKRIWRDCNNQAGIVRRTYYKTWAIAYFLAVRAYGWRYFSYNSFDLWR